MSCEFPDASCNVCEDPIIDNDWSYAVAGVTGGPNPVHNRCLDVDIRDQLRESIYDSYWFRSSDRDDWEAAGQLADMLLRNFAIPARRAQFLDSPTA